MFTSLWMFAQGGWQWLQAMPCFAMLKPRRTQNKWYALQAALITTN